MKGKSRRSRQSWKIVANDWREWWDGMAAEVEICRHIYEEQVEFTGFGDGSMVRGQRRGNIMDDPPQCLASAIWGW